MSRVYVIDSKIYAYNCVQRRAPITSIFEDIVRDLLELKKRGKIYVAFDVGHSSFREGEQSYYKGHRRAEFKKKSKEEQDAHKQFNKDYLNLIPLFRALDVTVLAVKGVEADDLMSLIALEHQDEEVVLLTADRDHLHSVVGTNNVTMYSGREFMTFDHNYVVENYGTKTRTQFTHLKTILGDAGDNLKAFRNLGPVKAKKVFSELYDGKNDVSLDDMEIYMINYLEENPRIKIHEYHLKEGRDTVRKVLESNLKVAATFTDLSNMTAEQVEEYEYCLNFNQSKVDFEQECIKIFGFPIILSNTARRIYNV